MSGEAPGGDPGAARGAQVLERLERLLLEAEQVPDPGARSRMRDLVRAVMDFHEAGLDQLVRLGEGYAPGLTLHLAGDPLVSSMLLAHDLHPRSAAARVRSAIERLRLHLKGQAQIELLEVDQGVLRARLSAPQAALSGSRQIVEQALGEAAPELRLELETLTQLRSPQVGP